MGQIDPFAILLDPNLKYCAKHDELYIDFDNIGCLLCYWQKRIARAINSKWSWGLGKGLGEEVSQRTSDWEQSSTNARTRGSRSKIACFWKRRLTKPVPLKDWSPAALQEQIETDQQPNPHQTITILSDIAEEEVAQQ